MYLVKKTTKSTDTLQYLWGGGEVGGILNAQNMKYASVRHNRNWTEWHYPQ